MRIGGGSVEQETTLYDDLHFLEKQDVAAGDKPAKDNYAYKLEGPEDYVVFVGAGTPVAPEFRDANGNKLDGSTRVIFQKCNKQGNPLSEYVLNELLSRWDYEKMRTDPDYQRKTRRDLMLDEREIAKIFLDIPDTAEGFSAANSNLLIGDDTSDFGVPVEIIEIDDLSPEEEAAVRAASQRGDN
jgi:hypothetical protein